MISPVNGVVDHGKGEVLKTVESIRSMAEEELDPNETSEKGNEHEQPEKDTGDDNFEKSNGEENADLKENNTLITNGENFSRSNDVESNAETEIDKSIASNFENYQDEIVEGLLKLSENEDDSMELNTCSPINKESLMSLNSLPITANGDNHLELDENNVDDTATLQNVDALSVEQVIMTQSILTDSKKPADSSDSKIDNTNETDSFDSCSGMTCEALLEDAGPNLDSSENTVQMAMSSCSDMTSNIKDIFEDVETSSLSQRTVPVPMLLSISDKQFKTEESLDERTVPLPMPLLVSKTENDLKCMTDQVLNEKKVDITEEKIEILSVHAENDISESEILSNASIQESKDITTFSALNNEQLDNESTCVDATSEDKTAELSLAEQCVVSKTNEICATNDNDLDVTVDKAIIEQAEISEQTNQEATQTINDKDVITLMLTDDELLNDIPDTAINITSNDLLVALNNDIIMADNYILNEDLKSSEQIDNTVHEQEHNNTVITKDNTVDDVVPMDIVGDSLSSISTTLEEQIDKTHSETSANSVAGKRSCPEPVTENEFAKRPKLADDNSSSNSSKTIVSLDFLKSFTSTISKMSRKDLEQFTLSKIIEAINHKTNVGELRAQVDAQELVTEQLRSRVETFKKQLKDLEFVHTSLEGQIIRVQKSGRFIPPPLITRSVGLQVSGQCANKLASDQQVRKKSITSAHTDTPLSEEISTPEASTSTTHTPGPASKTMRPITPPKSPPTGKTTSPTSKAPSVVAKKSLTTVPAHHQPPRHTSPKPTLASKPPAATKPVHSPKTTIVSKPMPTPALNKALGHINQSNNISRQTVQNDSTTTKSVIDLTDEDERVVARPVQGIRVRSPQKMPSGSAMSSGLAYLLPSTNGQQGQQIIIASNPQNSTNQQNFISRPQMFKTIPGLGAVAPGTVIRPAMMSTMARTTGPRTTNAMTHRRVHPAPLPYPAAQKSNPAWRRIPPKPSLKITKVDQGIVISWTMEHLTDDYEEIVSYQIYAYQETSALPSPDLWRKVGDVKAMPLPMACTLTQFLAGNRYHFAVRAVDVKSRVGLFSIPGNIMLVNE